MLIFVSVIGSNWKLYTPTKKVVLVIRLCNAVYLFIKTHISFIQKCFYKLHCHKVATDFYLFIFFNSRLVVHSDTINQFAT